MRAQRAKTEARKPIRGRPSISKGSGLRDGAERKSKGRKRSYENKRSGISKRSLGHTSKRSMNLIPRREKCSSKKSTIRTFISSIRKGLPMVAELEKLYDGLHKQFPGFVSPACRR